MVPESMTEAPYLPVGRFLLQQIFTLRNRRMLVVEQCFAYI